MGVTKKYGLAFYSAILIALGAMVAASLLLFFVTGRFSIYLLPFGILVWVFCFLLLQFRIQKHLNSEINKLYKEMRLQDGEQFSKPLILTDMEMLKQEVARFAEGKRSEIETLNIRENYRREFMGNIAHELKTPLFTVQGYILTLLDGAMKDKKVRKKYLQGASKGVERLVHIVRDLDMITQLESGGLILNKDDFDIVSLIKSVLQLLEIRASKKNISLILDKDYEEPVFVNADRERIEQVLINLVMNSIKYGKVDGTTEVAVEPLSSHKTLVRITDNGEGIDRANLSRIFERFYRVDKSGSRKEGGSGLGLSIVKHIVEGHLEKIYVESQLGIGSEFSFTLENGKER